VSNGYDSGVLELLLQDLLDFVVRFLVDVGGSLVHKQDLWVGKDAFVQAN
jgi:hypothetical protein